MKMIQKIAALAALLAISVSAFAESYVRPELLYGSAEFNGSGFSKDIGFGVTGGTTLGAQAEHDLSLSVSLTTFSKDYSRVYSGTTSNSETKIKVMPVLFNYRYLFLGKTSPIRPYLGASLGVANIKYTSEGTASNPIATPVSMSWSDSTSTTSFAYGATAGLVWNINDRFALDLGYRYSTAKADIYGSNPTLKISTIALGVRFRF